MHEENAIEVHHLTKCYPLYQRPQDRLKEALSFTRKSWHEDFYALNDISFSIRKGESVGIIGTNGSGKSTLLKIVVGVLNGTSGSVETDGRISAMLELGAGFNPDYTGMENIYFNGTIMGISKEEMDKRIQSIIDFADIGEFIHQPVKTYSSGMFVRLAFATQIYSDPDILIVDEALSVGDLRFQQKCYRAMEKLMKDKTVILVTHDPGAVLRFCKRAIWLERGHIRFDGAPDDALKQYQAYLIQKTVEESQGNQEQFLAEDAQAQEAQSHRAILPLVSKVKPKGSGDATILACELDRAMSGEPAEIFNPGEEVVFRMRVEYHRLIPHPMIGLTVRNRLGSEVIGINSGTIGCKIPAGEGIMEYELRFTLPPLNHGQYTVSPAVASGFQEDHMQLCWVDDALVIQIPKRLYDIPGVNYIDVGNIDVYRV